MSLLIFIFVGVTKTTIDMLTSLLRMIFESSFNKSIDPPSDYNYQTKNRQDFISFFI